MKKLLLLLSIAISVVTFFCTNSVYAQLSVRKIYLKRKQVFDSTSQDWFFAGNFANALHTLTKKYVIDDEILFEQGEELYRDDAEETERNLRRSGLFSSVNVVVDTIDDRTADITITTQDIWSTNLFPVFHVGGGISSLGGFFREINVGGTGSSIMAQGLYRTENSIGWDGIITGTYRRFLRSEMSLSFALSAHRYRTVQQFSLFQPFRTLSSPFSFGIAATNSYGSDFIYSPSLTQRVPYHIRRAESWFSLGMKRKDRLFFSAYIGLEDVQRVSPNLRQPYDNSGKILLGFSSLQQKFTKTLKLNGYETEDMAYGGWGTAVIGRIFTIGSQGENLYYVGGQIQQSVAIGQGYIFGQLSGASGFERGNPRYTYQEFAGVGHYRFSDKFLIASRVRQQTVWNWNAFRQLILDNDAGLRGYGANTLEGANRIITNTELRIYPEAELWIFKLSGVLFHDIGTIWKQSDQIFNTRFYNAIGGGIRIHNLKASGTEAIIRIDLAYNTHDKTFGGIILSTGQLFSIFGSHNFKLPEVYGMTIDSE